METYIYLPIVRAVFCCLRQGLRVPLAGRVRVQAVKRRGWRNDNLRLVCHLEEILGPEDVRDLRDLPSADQFRIQSSQYIISFFYYVSARRTASLPCFPLPNGLSMDTEGHTHFFDSRDLTGLAYVLEELEEAIGTFLVGFNLWAIVPVEDIADHIGYFLIGGGKVGLDAGGFGTAFAFNDVDDLVVRQAGIFVRWQGLLPLFCCRVMLFCCRHHRHSAPR